MDPRTIIGVFFAGSMLFASAVLAEQRPEQEILEETTSLETCTEAEVRAWRFIRVGQARLALADCSSLSHPFAPPLKLTFAYGREVPGHAFSESAMAMLERNLDGDSFQAKRDRFEEFNSAYRDTSDGDVYQLHFGSGGEFVLTFNGEVIAREQGDDFANAYMTIWFGERPFSRPLKTALLEHQGSSE